jgi:cytochrome c peroxidase
MGHYQLDKKLSDDQVADMVAFLKSLTGKVPEHFSPPEALAAPKGQGQGDEAETDDKAGGEAAKKAG